MIKKILLAAIFVFILVSEGVSQEAPDWNGWSWLMGEWIGEGGGQPGEGAGTFSFSFDLDRNILVRRSHSEYPATDGGDGISHDDLMIIYLDPAGAPSQAVYFDNERHTIFYSVTYGENAIILTSDKTDNAPVFRLVYTLLDNETVHTAFEMSRDGITFMTYVEGTSKKAEARR